MPKDMDGRRPTEIWDGIRIFPSDQPEPHHVKRARPMEHAKMALAWQAIDSCRSPNPRSPRQMEEICGEPKEYPYSMPKTITPGFDLSPVCISWGEPLREKMEVFKGALRRRESLRRFCHIYLAQWDVFMEMIEPDLFNYFIFPIS